MGMPLHFKLMLIYRRRADELNVGFQLASEEPHPPAYPGRAFDAKKKCALFVRLPSSGSYCYIGAVRKAIWGMIAVKRMSALANHSTLERKILEQNTEKVCNYLGLSWSRAHRTDHEMVTGFARTHINPRPLL